jgi:hypothetical protein
MCLIYTDESGTIKDEDFNPDPDQLKETSLTNDQAKRLLKAVRNNVDVDQDRLDEICSMLGVDPPQKEIEATQESIAEMINQALLTEGFPTDNTLTPNGEDVRVDISALDQSTKNNSLEIRIHIELESAISTEQHKILYVITLSGNGLETYNALVKPDNNYWKIRSEIHSQKGFIIPKLVKVLEDNGYNTRSDEFDIDSSIYVLPKSTDLI